MVHGDFDHGYFNCFLSAGTCFLLSVVYVASLYVWNEQHNRNHPTIIKKRFLSVLIMMFVSPVFLYFGMRNLKASLWEVMGLKTTGLLQACVIPLLLTAVLFLGPICQQMKSTALDNAEKFSLVWWRNHVIAPVSEETTFRACMLPVLLQCFQPATAILICPLFFGVAHFHHALERLRSGMDRNSVIFVSCFQFFYTTLFGAYSAFLFYRTGHLAAPLVAHMFCNHMGFPELVELAAQTKTWKFILCALYVTGLVLWYKALVPATDPSWYV